MSWALQHAALVALWRAVPAIGVVHDEEPFGQTEGEFQALYAWRAQPADPLRVRGWFIRRLATQERERHGTVYNRHTWALRGFMSLDHTAGSGKAFDALIEAGRAAYRADPTLGGTAQPNTEENGVQVLSVQPVVFAGLLCHSAELQLRTMDYLALA